MARQTSDCCLILLYQPKVYLRKDLKYRLAAPKVVVQAVQYSLPITYKKLACRAVLLRSFTTHNGTSMQSMRRPMVRNSICLQRVSLSMAFVTVV